MSNYKHPFGATHYVVIGPGGPRHPGVKVADFFCSQGGHKEEWGASWVPVVADGIDHARLLAWFIGSGTSFPNAIGFTPPNRRTVAQLRADGYVWEKELRAV